MKIVISIIAIVCVCSCWNKADYKSNNGSDYNLNCHDSIKIEDEFGIDSLLLVHLKDYMTENKSIPNPFNRDPLYVLIFEKERSDTVLTISSMITLFKFESGFESNYFKGIFYLESKPVAVYDFLNVNGFDLINYQQLSMDSVNLFTSESVYEVFDKPVYWTHNPIDYVFKIENGVPVFLKKR